MDPSLIGLLALFIAGAALTYHFGFVHPSSTLEWRIKAGFVVFTAMLIPVVVYVLVLQSGAVDRLGRLGVEPFPGVRHVVGAAAGQGEAPVWVFATDPAGGPALEWYDDPATRTGWTIAERSAGTLILVRDEARLSIATSGTGSSKRVIYLLR